MYFVPRSKDQHDSNALWTLVLLDMYPRVVPEQGKLDHTLIDKNLPYMCNTLIASPYFVKL